MKDIVFSDGITKVSDGAKTCANCKSNTLHINSVTIYGADIDEYSCNTVFQYDKKKEMKVFKGLYGSLNNNRIRELSLAVEYDCELCDQKTYDVLEFHKGTINAAKYIQTVR